MASRRKRGVNQLTLRLQTVFFVHTSSDLHLPETGSGVVALKGKRTISHRFGADVDDKARTVNVVLEIKINAVTESGDPSFTAESAAVGIFKCEPETEVSKLRTLADDLETVHPLVAQIYPVVVTNIQHMLWNMGIQGVKMRMSFDPKNVSKQARTEEAQQSQS